MTCYCHCQKLNQVIFDNYFNGIRNKYHHHVVNVNRRKIFNFPLTKCFRLKVQVDAIWKREREREGGGCITKLDLMKEKNK